MRHRVTTDMPVQEAKGLPRPIVDYPDRPWRTDVQGFRRNKMIVPWINWGSAVNRQNWTDFDEEAVAEAMEREFDACATCGEPLGENKIFGLVGQAKEGQKLNTSGTAMHPQCALLAFHYCPHLNERGDKAFALYTGEGHGHEIPDDLEEGELADSVLGYCYLSEEAKVITINELKALAAEEKREV